MDNYRDKLEMIKYVDTFSNIILRWEQWNERAPPVPPSTPDERNRNRVNGRWQGVKEMDAAEEEYFNTSDDEDQPTPVKATSPTKQQLQAASPSRNNGRNGRPSTPSKPLVDYEDDDDAMEGSDDTAATLNNATYKDITATSTSPADSNSPPQTPKLRHATSSSSTLTPTSSTSTSPIMSPTESSIPTPERLAEKRRRTELEDDDDELGKLSSKSNKKRTSPTAEGDGAKGKGVFLQRKRSGLVMASIGKTAEASGPPAKKIAISLGAGKTGGATASSGSQAANSSKTRASLGEKSKKPLKAVDGEEGADTATEGEEDAVDVKKLGNGTEAGGDGTAPITTSPPPSSTAIADSDGGGGDGGTAGGPDPDKEKE